MDIDIVSSSLVVAVDIVFVHVLIIVLATTNCNRFQGGSASVRRPHITTNTNAATITFQLLLYLIVKTLVLVSVIGYIFIYMITIKRLTRRCAQLLELFYVNVEAHAAVHAGRRNAFHESSGPRSAATATETRPAWTAAKTNTCCNSSSTLRSFSFSFSFTDLLPNPLSVAVQLSTRVLPRKRALPR